MWQVSKISSFLSLTVNILRTVADTAKVTILRDYLSHLSAHSDSIAPDTRWYGHAPACTVTWIFRAGRPTMPQHETTKTKDANCKQAVIVTENDGRCVIKGQLLHTKTVDRKTERDRLLRRVSFHIRIMDVSPLRQLKPPRRLRVICEMRNCERVICETPCETRCDWSTEISIFRRLPCTIRACKLCNLRNGKRENANVFTYCSYDSVSCRPILWCKRSSVVDCILLC